jgi:acyl carrier protein
MNTEQIYLEIREIIADVLDQPDIQITADTAADDVEGWDSFNHINIVVAVEAHFGIKFHTAEIEEVRNVGELVELIAKKLKAKKPS